MVTKVTPVPQRRSTRVTNPPQRLREETPEGENPKTLAATGISLPAVTHILQDVAAESDLTAESPAPNGNLKPPLELDISDSESQSSSSHCRRHSSDNYTRKVTDHVIYLI